MTASKQTRLDWMAELAEAINEHLDAAGATPDEQARAEHLEHADRLTREFDSVASVDEPTPKNSDLPTAADLEFIAAEHTRRVQRRSLPDLEDYAAALQRAERDSHPKAPGYQALAEEARLAKHAAALVRRGDVTELTRRMVRDARRDTQRKAQLCAERAIADEPRSSLDALI